MAEEMGGDKERCNLSSYVVNISNPVFRAMQGGYFIGQTKLLLFGDKTFAWGGLVNPSDSEVNLFLNVFTVSNYSMYPFVCQVWFNASVPGHYALSGKVSPTNLTVRPSPEPAVQLQFAEMVADHPVGGVNPFNRIIPARSTIVDEKKGEIIIPPGGSIITYLAPPGQSMVRARVAFGWWEEPIC